MVGSRLAISTSILGMRWRTAPLAPTTSLKAVSSLSLLFVEHFSSTSKSLGRVSLIPWTVAHSSSGLTRFLSSHKIEALVIPSAGLMITASGRAWRDFSGVLESFFVLFFFFRRSFLLGISIHYFSLLGLSASSLSASSPQTPPGSL